MDSKTSTFVKHSSLKTRFTRRFVSAFDRIRKQKPRSTSLSSREIYKQYCKIRLAAEASMAIAVGPKRAWTRAVLCKIRRQQRRTLSAKRVKRVHHTKARAKIGKKKIDDEGDNHEHSLGQAKQLRKLVPGGKEMDLCSLLAETAHYIQCLNTQVQVMRSIADFYSG